jgi:hypothetical protein
MCVYLTLQPVYVYLNVCFYNYSYIMCRPIYVQTHVGAGGRAHTHKQVLLYIVQACPKQAYIPKYMHNTYLHIHSH